MTKKKQTTTLSLQNFLAETETIESSWVDDSHELPTAPLSRDSRPSGSSRDDRRPPHNAKRASEKEVPLKPPFTVHVGHLPYDMDEEELGLIFFNRHCAMSAKPTIVRAGNNSKGFGYIQFVDRDSMLKALDLNGLRVKSKSITVDVAEERNKSFDRQHNRPSLPPREEPTEDPKLATANWRSEKKPSPTETEAPEKSVLQRSNISRSSSNFNDSTSHRNEMNSRSNMNFRNRSRSGHRQRQDYHHNQRQGDYHRDSHSQNYNFHRRDTSRSSERYDRNSTQRRSNSIYRSEKRSPSKTVSDEAAPKPPVTIIERPKLKISPRTLPLPDTTSPSTPSPIVTPVSTSNKPNPFGAAKPVDTTPALQKIEEKITELRLSHSKPLDTNTSSESTSKHSPRSPSFKSKSSPRSRSRSAQRKHDSEHDSVVSNDHDSASIDATKEISSRA